MPAETQLFCNEMEDCNRTASACGRFLSGFEFLHGVCRVHEVWLPRESIRVPERVRELRLCSRNPQLFCNEMDDSNRHGFSTPCCSSGVLFVHEVCRLHEVWLRRESIRVPGRVKELRVCPRNPSRSATKWRIATARLLPAVPLVPGFNSSMRSVASMTCGSAAMSVITALAYFSRACGSRA